MRPLALAQVPEDRLGHHLAVEGHVAVGVEQRAAALEHQRGQPPVGVGAQIEHVAIDHAVAVEIAGHALAGGDELVPGVERGDVDPRRLHQIAPVGEHHRVHVVRQRVEAPLRRPEAEARRDQPVGEPVGAQQIGQIDEADVAGRPAGEESQRALEHLRQIGDLGAGQHGVLQAAAQRRPVGELDLHGHAVRALEGRDGAPVGVVVRLGEGDQHQIGAGRAVAAGGEPGRGRRERRDGDPERGAPIGKS